MKPMIPGVTRDGEISQRKLGKTCCANEETCTEEPNRSYEEEGE